MEKKSCAAAYPLMELLHPFGALHAQYHKKGKAVGFVQGTPRGVFHEQIKKLNNTS